LTLRQTPVPNKLVLVADRIVEGDICRFALASDWLVRSAVARCAARIPAR